MNERTKLGSRIIAVAAVVLTVSAGLLITHVSAPQESIGITSANAAVGGEATVTIQANGITGLGLGAWTIDVVYDASLLTALACIPEHGGVCNTMFDPGVVRVTGASAGGVAGDNTLASITFRCDAAGTSALTVDVDLLVDATIGDPQVIDHVVTNGSVTCGAAPTPSSGGVFDCADFDYQDTAQVIFEADPSDPHNLDPDTDGIACEGLPPLPDGMPVGGFPSVGTGGDGAPSTARVVNWLTAALAGISLAGLAAIAVLWMRGYRLAADRTRRS